MPADAPDADPASAIPDEPPATTPPGGAGPASEPKRSARAELDARFRALAPVGVEPEGRPAPWRLALAVALPLLAVVAVFVLAPRFASSADSDAPVAVPVVAQPGSTSAGCASLDAALPTELDGHQRRTLAVTEPGVAAWGQPPVVLRCGIEDPAELTCSATLDVVNDVSWLVLTQSGSSTYITADREQRVAVTLDDSVGIGAVQALSNILERVMPVRPVCVDGTLNPVDPP